MSAYGNYSANFKHEAVKKYLNRGTKTIEEIADELNIPSRNLYRWIKSLCGSDMNSNRKTGKRSPEEKLKIIMETASLGESELGEYLRKNGLHSQEIEAWKEAFIGAIKWPGRPRKDEEVSSLRKKEKELQKELNRKEKALAEMAARVVLLKKSQEIFGETEEEE